MRLYHIILFCVILISASCKFKPVHPSLWTFGSPERKYRKVLDYYSAPEDSLKLRAAEFLIQHTENHFSYVPDNKDEIDNFFENLNKQVSIAIPVQSKLYELLKIHLTGLAISNALSDGTLHKPKYRMRTDVKTITDDFLIENIEYAFKAWEFPWAQHVSFNNFCLYILPYRYGNEPPSPWRKIAYERLKWIADSLENPNDAMEAAALINKQFQSVLSYTKELTRKGIKPGVANQIEANIFGNCFEQAGLGVSILRAMGIQATVVKIPQWGHFFSGHEITGMLDSENKWHGFDFGGNGPEVYIDIHPPKMFFKRFDKMERFKPVLEDASEILMRVNDLEVYVNAKDDDKIYLCVFNRNSWIPIFEGQNTMTKAYFEDVGYRSKMYLAAVKSKGKMKPVSSLFLPDTLGNITYYKPNLSKRITATLTRKYPGYNEDMPRLKSLIGGEFSISNSKDFANNSLLYKINKPVKYDYNIEQCISQMGKYVRYDFPQSEDSVFDGPAEISFYTTENDKLKKIEGKYFGSSQLSTEHIQLITDNDMLSYVEVWDCEEDPGTETSKFVLRKNKEPIWIGMEMDSATTVTHVGFCPRNDKNGIYAGMRYELFYWDDKWISLGKKVASGDSVSFDGIPENSVLWLRNLDEGKEERIFTLENGEQKWW